MTDKVLKRGYYKWTDENGVRHKVKASEMDILVESENPNQDELLLDGTEEEEAE